jgi:hypothetical protein
MSPEYSMGCAASNRKNACPLCREVRRSYRDLLCDKCAFVREYTVLHGREGLRQGLGLRRTIYLLSCYHAGHGPLQLVPWDRGTVQ